MGKRELVLISIFIVLGIAVYQVTAPPAPPGSEGVSVSGIIGRLRRGIRGARETAAADSTQTAAVDPSVRELRVKVARASDLTITGEDRTDIAVAVHATARGYNQAEAKAAADTARLLIQQVGDAIVCSIDRTTQRGLPANARIDQLTIAIKMPHRLSLRIEPHAGRLIVSNAMAAEIMGSRGETRISAIAGRLVVTQSDEELVIDGAGTLTLNARNSRGSITNVSGTASLETVGGQLRLGDVAGPLEIDARNTDVRLEKLDALKPPLRFNGSRGELRIEGLRTETRIDGRNTDIDVTLDTAAAVTIYNVGDINVTAPPMGYALDAVSVEGGISLEDGGITPSEGPDARAAGKVRGGGPTLTLRASRGRIQVRKPRGK
jgi:hypothetical protein